MVSKVLNVANGGSKLRQNFERTHSRSFMILVESPRKIYVDFI